MLTLVVTQFYNFGVMLLHACVRAHTVSVRPCKFKPDSALMRQLAG